MPKIKFGTDGWRAVISEDFTFKNVEIVAQAISDFVKSRKEPVYRKRKLALGYDTRFLSGKFAESIAGVLAANGIEVIISDGPCPTPAVCVEIRDKKLTGGVMVTASHNPPQYNGIKYKGYFAGSAGSDIIDRIEEKLYNRPVKNISLDEGIKKGKIVYADIISLQLEYVKKYADMKLLKNAALKVLVDSMNGTGLRHMERLLKNSRIKIDFMYDAINPNFNERAPEPNAKHLQELMRRVKNGPYALGVATDGDADRVAIADEKGNLLSGHKVMALLLLHLVENRNMRGGVVQTICGTALINNICKRFGLAVHETPVGFKYICDIMTKKDILIGGEETGGIAFKNYVPERDGFLSALLIMELMVRAKKPLSRVVSDMNKKYGNFVYERLDLVFPEEKRGKLTKGIKNNLLKKVLNKKVVQIRDYDGTKFICEDGSWLLLRLSGTEPKLRIYSETHSRKKSLKYLEFGRRYAFSLM